MTGPSKDTPKGLPGPPPTPDYAGPVNAPSANTTALKIQHIDVMIQEGKLAQARVMAQRLMQASPGDIDVIRLMARLALRSGEMQQCFAMTERALKLAPHHFMLAAEHANSMQVLKRYSDAVKLLEPWTQKHPNSPEVFAMLLSAYLLDNRCVQAERAGRRAIELGINQPAAGNELSVALMTQGRPEAALQVLKETMRHWPQDFTIIDSLCFLLNYVPGVTNDEMLRAHQAYGAMLASTHHALPLKPYDRAPNGKLRVGIISADFRSHSVAYFIEPFMRHFDRSRFELFGYQLNMVGDAVTARLKSFANKWAVFGYISDHGIIEKVRADKVDVLIELAGHTNCHCLPAMQFRAAPVQATYCGYPNTTGVHSIDYRLVDKHTDPPGTEKYATEKLIRLEPCFLSYQPPEHAPEPAPLPSIASGSVTFGSFNTPSKLNDTVVKLWAKVVLAVPGSRLLLKGMTFADADLQTVTLARFEAAGLDKSRITIHSHKASLADHLALYGSIDIGLDPVPYNGTTTTCEAMWMGVPVITMRGTRHAGRVGVSLMHAVGLTEMIAEDEAGYIELAVGLAGDRERLTALRGSLRDRVRNSPLCDGPGFARSLERAIEEMASSPRQDK
jgi:protein O-GlcNAc transferase